MLFLPGNLYIELNMNSFYKTILWILGFFLFIFFVYLAFVAVVFAKMGECGMSVGPVYGRPIAIKPSEIRLEKSFEIHGGKIGFMNLEDKIAPKMIKFDAQNKIVWAVEFNERDNDIGIPFHRISILNFEGNNGGYIFRIFNNSYSEPGIIYLDKNYNLEYMCLSPM